MTVPRKVEVVRPETDGLSPKVWLPAVIGLAVGVILLLTGHDDTGVTVLVSTAGYGGIGIVAKPGTILARPLTGEDVARRYDE